MLRGRSGTRLVTLYLVFQVLSLAQTKVTLQFVRMWEREPGNRSQLVSFKDTQKLTKAFNYDKGTFSLSNVHCIFDCSHCDPVILHTIAEHWRRPIDSELTRRNVDYLYIKYTSRNYSMRKIIIGKIIRGR